MKKETLLPIVTTIGTFILWTLIFITPGFNPYLTEIFGFAALPLMVIAFIMSIAMIIGSKRIGALSDAEDTSLRNPKWPRK
ncbi:MAG: hypothetical protein COB67_02575 [SAR324 cluster bacterium]|uniref:Uncharacterized protein n=1 Tax=SAR324 cluster bacterium TaxID=2024889 RepID=A0A2A4T989_9DELT|nr:MAG: hypothetical protein COB67_02575 [SAR324 cluster bacterium]